MDNNRNRRRTGRRRRRRRRINYKPLIAIAVLIVLVIAVILLIKSCSHDVGDLDLKANQSAVYLKDDGSVVYGAAEDFGGQEFDESALKTQVEDEVKQFNEKNGSVSDAMELDDFDVSDDFVKVVFSFKTRHDFSVYMNQYNRENDFIEQKEDGKKTYEFYLGSIKDYEGDKKVSLTKPDKSGNTTLQDADGSLFLVTGNYQIQIDQTIDYVSEGCSVDGNVVSTTKDSKGYIIFN